MPQIDHIARTNLLYEQIVRPILSFSTKRRLDLILDEVAGKEVLDLGCVEHEASIAAKPDWWLHGLIAQRAASVLGIDNDSESVAALRRSGHNILTGNVEDFNLDSTFDIVVSGELFEHLENRRSFLECVRRHLRPGGVWVASMPNGNSLNYFLQTAIVGHEVDAWDHTAFFTPVTLSVMLKRCGFTPTKIVLFQPDEIFHHSNPAHRIAALLSNKFQQVCCLIRPSLARGLFVVATPA